MRIKFPDSPEKFMESELELHEILQEMRVLSTAPDYYPLLVKLHVIPSLLELLAHDNTDVAVSKFLIIKTNGVESKNNFFLGSNGRTFAGIN